MKNRSKKKLTISIVSLCLVFGVVITSIAWVLAATTQTLTSSISIVYQAISIDGSVAATYTIGDETKDFITDTNDTVLTFEGDADDLQGELSMQDEGAVLTAQNKSVLIDYVFTNTGTTTYTAIMDYDESASTLNNVKVEYSLDNVNYSSSQHALVLGAESEKHYYVKISVDNLAKDSSFNTAYSWKLEYTDDTSNLTAMNYSMNSDGETYTASYNGEAVDNGVLYVPSNIGGAEITSVTGANATETEKASVSEVVIPDSIETIENNAFSGYTNLENVNYGDTASTPSTFAKNTSNSTPQLKTIGYRAFHGCTSLKTIDIPASVTSIGMGAYANCKNVTEINYDAVNAIFSMEEFTGFEDLAFFSVGCVMNVEEDTLNVTVSEQVESVALNILSNCETIPAGLFPFSGITEINMQENKSVTSISESSFTFCTLLNSVDIGTSVTSIGIYAFNGCSGLTEIVIPNSVTSIGDYAFYGCSGLETLTIGSGVTSIGDSAFSGCTIVERLEYDANITSGFTTTSYQFKDIGTNAETCEVIIGDKVTSVPRYLFYNCEAITSLTIGSSVTSIGERAFNGCSGLTEIVIPNSVTSIGERAFNGCSSLVNLTIGSGVTSIGDYAFNVYAENLESIVIDENNPNYDSREECNAIIEKSTNTLVLGCKNTVIPNSVTSIGDFAFYNCSGLTEIVIPNSVTGIGGSAFNGCSGLTEIVIPNSVTSIRYSAFYDCSGLTEIVIPNSVTGIGNNAFFGCTNVERLEYDANITTGFTTSSYPFKNIGTNAETCEVIIGDKVTSVPTYLFYNCEAITSLTIGNSVTSIGERAFNGCSGLTEIVIPNSVTSIGYSAFYDCSGLETLTIGSGVTSIGDYAFSVYAENLESIVIDENNPNYDSREECNAIIEKSTNTLIYGCKNTVIPNSVTSIGEEAFDGCSGLTEIVIPNSVTSIGQFAFYKCIGLESVTIGSGVTSIGQRAFNGCSGLESIVVDENNPNYDSREECNAIIEKSTNTLVAGCKNTVIPNSVTSIRRCAFYGCSGLTEIVIPNSVTNIGESAFFDCSGLTEIVIPNSVTSIGGSAFRDCTGLEILTIGSGVTSIESGAFRDCTGLTTLTIPNSVTSIGYSAFHGCSGLTEIVIPNSVTSIGDYAFYGCSGLKTLTIGSGVTSIGNNAFYGCSSLESVTFENTEGWFITSSSTATSGTAVDVTASNTNLVDWLTKSSGNYNRYWKRSA